MTPRRTRIVFTKRAIPVSADRYICQCRISGLYWTMSIDLTGSEHQGNTLYAQARLLAPQARSEWFEPGTHFELVEGPETIGHGVVLHQVRRKLRDSADVENQPRFLEESAA